MNPLELAQALTREVRTGERDGQPTKIAIARRSYPAEQADVWDALTNPERLPRWFLPVSGDLGAGGRYQFEGNAGGTVESCRKPEAIALTWEFGGQISWLQIRLSPDGDETVVELEHEAHVDPEFWKQFGPGAAGVGWDLAFFGLGAHLATGGDRPAESDEWTTSVEGKEFVRYASEAWVEAAIKDGEDPAAARDAGAATFAFYTTAPEPPA